MASSNCFNDPDLRRLVHSRIALQEQGSFEEHLESCAICRDRLDDLAGRIALPEENGAETNRQPSAELARAIARLENMEPARAASKSDASQFPFLSPTSRPDGLGRLGKYEVLHVLGEGGMAIVFAAWDPILNREVAIKVPSRALIANSDSRDRFLREARAIAAVKNDNIVTVHAVEDQADTTYLVMERIEGQTLAQRLEEVGRLACEEAVRIGSEIAAALQEAHARGLVHRDIKPGNILLEDPAGRVKVTDFGLAKSHVDVSLTATGVLAGTPEFMSPEQANEGEATELSDLFSLGLVLYVACSGDSPFRAKTVLTTLRRVCTDDVVPLHQVDPQIPRWLSNLVQRLMSKKPSGRPQSAQEVVELLSRRGFAKPEGPKRSFRSASRDRPSRPRVRQWKRLALAASTVVAIVPLAMALLSPESDPSSSNPLEPIVRGFVVMGNPEPFSSLAAAIQAAHPDGVVEVHGDGPYSVQSLGAIEERLTIRAAQGSRPVFVPASEDSLADGPFLVAMNDVDLQGIDVRWQVRRRQAIRLGALSDIRRYCVIDVDGGSLRLLHCRLVTEHNRNGCIYIGQGSAELSNSHLVSGLGTCLLVGSSGVTRIQVEHCVLEGRNGFMFDAAKSGARPVELDLDRNTISASRAIQLVFGELLSALKVSARGNHFDTPEFMTLIRSQTFRGRRLSRTDLQTTLVERIEWTESRNVYRADQRLLSRTVGRVNAPVQAVIENLDDWLALWNQTHSGSVEAAFATTISDEGESFNPGPFARIRSVKTSLDEAVGADLRRVGPEVYSTTSTRWKNRNRARDEFESDG